MHTADGDEPRTPVGLSGDSPLHHAASGGRLQKVATDKRLIHAQGAAERQGALDLESEAWV